MWVVADPARFVDAALGKRIALVTAPADGVVVGHATNPIVYHGDLFAHLAMR